MDALAAADLKPDLEDATHRSGDTRRHDCVFARAHSAVKRHGRPARWVRELWRGGSANWRVVSEFVRPWVARRNSSSNVLTDSSRTILSNNKAGRVVARAVVPLTTAGLGQRAPHALVTVGSGGACVGLYQLFLLNGTLF